MEPREIFEKAYDILVQHAGASASDHWKPTFVSYYLGHGTEWRFGGLLGFGGKFWRNDNRYYVSCYPEDRTPARELVIDRVNFLLKDLPYYEPV